MIKLKRKIRFLMTISLAFYVALTLLPTKALATQIRDNADSDYLYYSDIFWKYPKALVNTAFANYRSQVHNALSGVLGEYVETSAFTAANIELGIEVLLLDWTEFAKYLSDNAFGTSFMLNDKIDKANITAQIYLKCDRKPPAVLHHY